METELEINAKRFYGNFAEGIAFSVEYPNLEEIASLEEELKSNPDEKEAMENLAELIDSCNTAITGKDNPSKKLELPPEIAERIIGMMKYFYEDSSEKEKSDIARLAGHYSTMLFGAYFTALEEKLTEKESEAMRNIEKNSARTVRYAVASILTGIGTVIATFMSYDSGFFWLTTGAGTSTCLFLLHKMNKYGKETKKYLQKHENLSKGYQTLIKKKLEFYRKLPSNDNFYRILEKYEILVKPLLYAKIA